MSTPEEVKAKILKTQINMPGGIKPGFIPSHGITPRESPGTVIALYGVIRPPMMPPVKLPPGTPVMLYGIPVRPPGHYEPPVAHPLYGVPSRPLPPGYAVPLYGIPNPGRPPAGHILIQHRHTGKIMAHPGHRY